MLQSIDPRTGSPFGEALAESTAADIDAVVAASVAAFERWSTSTGAARAQLVRAIAAALEAQRDQLVQLADRETALGAARLNGELDRTAFQLRGFAQQAEEGAPFRYIDDPAVAGAPPAGRPRLTRVRVPIGPVAMFAASNFPFAFSVLGGDTASALAAGCTVVVKAHPGHPQLAQAVFRLARGVIAAQGLDAGMLTLVQGASNDVGIRLVRHPDIAAVAFTGSFRGGAALQAEINARPRPIPFYGELGSINPIVALPGELASRGAELAKTLAGSITLGCGQFCTSPGVVIVFDDAASQSFVDALKNELAAITPHAMLTPAIKRGFEAGVAKFASHPQVRVLLAANTGGGAPTPLLAETSAAAFSADHSLHDEVFGPACLLVRVKSVDEAVAVLYSITGSLTATIWGAGNENADTLRLVRAAERIAGRVLFAGVPTGVAVTGAQQHGGPWPSSTQPFTTSVGYAALDRFLRPVALQDAPDWLLSRQGRPC